jgi:hypothetical protein
MPSLMAIIGGDSTPLKREMAAVEAMARRSGVSLQQGLSGGGGHSGSSGIIREFLVLTREMSAGNWTKVPGSMSILLQRMGILKLLLKDTAGQAEVLSQAWAQQAAKAGAAAVASTRKAAASAAALAAEGGETEATLAAAIADEEKAAADIVVARATQQKAAASAEAAVAARAEGAATKGGLSTFAKFGIVAAVAAAAIYAFYKIYEHVRDKLTGLKLPEAHFESIAKSKQAANAAAEAQKEINREVQKSVDLYNSAANAAERGAKVTKEHFEHLKKMNEYGEQRDLAKAKTEKDKEAVRAKYAAAGLRLAQEERNAEESGKRAEAMNLQAQSLGKKKEADAIRVSSREHDELIGKQRREKAEEGQKYLNSGGKDAAKLSNAHDWIRAARDWDNVMAGNEDLRKRKGDLYKEAEQAASKGAVAGLEAETLKKTNPQKAKDEADEAAAKLEAEKAGHKEHFARGHLTSLQQIGAYAPQAGLVTVAKKQLHHLASIDSKLGARGAGHDRELGRVQH